MKLFEKRWRISWPYFIFGTVFAAFTTLSIVSGDAAVIARRGDAARHFLREKEPTAFLWVVGLYAALTLIGYFFSRFQFRRGSWFNPI